MRHLLLLVTLCACSSDGTSGAGAATEAVPSDIAFVGLVSDTTQLGDEILKTFFEPGEIKAMRKEIFDYAEKRTGLKLAGVKATVFFALPGADSFAVILTGVGGTLKGEPIEEYAGHKIVAVNLSGEGGLRDEWREAGRSDRDYREPGLVFHATQHKDLLIVGSLGAVRAAVDAVTGKTESLKKGKTGLSKLLQAEAAGAIFAIGVDAESLPMEGRDQAEKFGVTGGVFVVKQGGIKVIVTGDNEGLKSLADLIEMGIDSVSSMVESRRKEMVEQGSLVEGMSAIALSHVMKRVKKLVKPRVAGGRLTIDIRLKLGVGGMLLGTVALAGAAAVPAFLSVEKKSATMEASSEVQKMAAAAQAYHLQNNRFPPTVGPTPRLEDCCRQKDGRCEPDPSLWQQPTWKALSFEVYGRDRYSYEFISGGTGKDAVFTAAAYGDLDCDGVYSTFEVRGRADGDTETFRDKEEE